MSLCNVLQQNKSHHKFEVIDKSLSLFEIDENGEAHQVNNHFFSSYGNQNWHLRFSEKLFFDHDTQKFMYHGSWRWAADLRKFALYDHLRIFTSDKDQFALGQVLFYGYDENGNRIATYDTDFNHSSGLVTKSNLQWYDRQRVGFWIEDPLIESGMILAFITSTSMNADKIYLQYHHSLTEKKLNDIKSIHSNGVGRSK